MRRRAVGATIVLAGAAVALAPASCRGVVVGDRLDAAQELCAILADCYPDDAVCGAVDANADAQTWQSFLEAFDPSQCLGTCAQARACADRAPFCGAGACSSDQQCCGWSRGIASCSDSGACCKPNGIQCADASECCGGQCTDRYCGGFACFEVGAACTGPAECCTKLCIDGQCSAEVCSPLDGPCDSVEECCPVVTQADTTSAPEGVVCKDSTCQLADGPVCAAEQDSCDAVACCDGLDCVAIEGGSYCVLSGCTQDGGTCDPGNDTCCAPFECNPDTLWCDFPPPVCADPGADCSMSFCCDGGDCVDGICEQPQCSGIDCHDICEAGGGPLDPSCTGDVVDGACISEVVATDYWCGCYGWDDVCVGEAQDLCGACT